MTLIARIDYAVFGAEIPLPQSPIQELCVDEEPEMVSIPVTLLKSISEILQGCENDRKAREISQDSQRRLATYERRLDYCGLTMMKMVLDVKDEMDSMQRQPTFDQSRLQFLERSMGYWRETLAKNEEYRSKIGRDMAESKAKFARVIGTNESLRLLTMADIQQYVKFDLSMTVPLEQELGFNDSFDVEFLKSNEENCDKYIREGLNDDPINMYKYPPRLTKDWDLHHADVEAKRRCYEEASANHEAADSASDKDTPTHSTVLESLKQKADDAQAALSAAIESAKFAGLWYDESGNFVVNRVCSCNKGTYSEPDHTKSHGPYQSRREESSAAEYMERSHQTTESWLKNSEAAIDPDMAGPASPRSSDMFLHEGMFQDADVNDSTRYGSLYELELGFRDAPFGEQD